VAKYSDGFDVRLHYEALAEPLKWNKKRAQRVLVCSMGDLFHEAVPDDFIRRVFDVMHLVSHHAYFVLTKRVERMAALGASLDWGGNVWAGATVEDSAALPRLDLLRAVPASRRFVVFEPLIERIGASWFSLDGIHWVICGGETGRDCRPCDGPVQIRYACLHAKVPFWFTSWGGYQIKRGPALVGQQVHELPAEFVAKVEGT